MLVICSSMLYWYKAKERKFHMGSPEFWTQHNARYNPKGNTAQEDTDISAVGNRKTNVVVNKV